MGFPFKLAAVVAGVSVGCAVHPGFRNRVAHFAIAGGVKAAAAKELLLDESTTPSAHYRAFELVVGAVRDSIHGSFGVHSTDRSLEEWAGSFREAESARVGMVVPANINFETEEVPQGVWVDPCEGTYEGCTEGRPVMVYVPSGLFLWSDPMVSAGAAVAFARGANASTLICGHPVAPSATLSEQVDAVKACLVAAHARRQQGGGKLIITGVGSGAALALLSLSGTTPPVDALWLNSPWLNMKACPASDSDLPKAWPCEKLLKHLRAEQQPAEVLKGLKLPTFLTWGDRDGFAAEAEKAFAGHEKDWGKHVSAGAASGVSEQTNWHNENRELMYAAKLYFKDKIGR
eukprot:Hpha_TRINITY_DN18357_c0_g1::TRINITY_DN18357_c0_g1_i1::g.158343::m.158343